MTEVTRYALWILPEETATARFAELINGLSDRYGGPRFSPHVTLLGWVTGPEARLVATTERLAQQLHVVTLRLRRLAGEAYYFRCFYARLEKSAELVQAHQQASDLFKSGYASDYLPHLSLIYGHLSPREKAKLRTEMKNSLPEEFTVDRLQLIRIALAVHDWRAVNTCPLQAVPLPGPPQ